MSDKQITCLKFNLMTHYSVFRFSFSFTKVETSALNKSKSSQVDVRTKNDNSGSYCGSPRQAIKFDTRIITLEDTKTSPRPSGFKIYKYCNNEFTRTFISMKNITTIRTLFEMVVSINLINI